jgi:hypothetical protein
LGNLGQDFQSSLLRQRSILMIQDWSGEAVGWLIHITTLPNDLLEPIRFRLALENILQDLL